MSETHNLVTISRSKGSLDELASQFGGRLHIVTGSVTDPKVVEQAISAATSKYGALHSVVANAGVLEPVSTVETANVDEWKKLFDINFFSLVELVKVAIPFLRLTNGNIVAVLSGASIKSYHGWGAYGASKAALDHFIETVAVENPDLSAISIAPGVVATDMQKLIREKHSENMSADAVKKFKSLFENRELLHPDVPARVYVNLAVNGWPLELNGKYLRYNDSSLSEYSE